MEVRAFYASELGDSSYLSRFLKRGRPSPSIRSERPLLLISSDRAQERESIRQLACIGYDRMVGALDGGIDVWASAGRPVRCFRRSAARELEDRLKEGDRLIVVDVRERDEWFTGHIPRSVNIPVHDIPLEDGIRLARGPELAVHSGHTYRATLGASLLEQVGHERITVIDDGNSGWVALRATSGR